MPFPLPISTVRILAAGLTVGAGIAIVQGSPAPASGPDRIVVDRGVIDAIHVAFSMREERSPTRGEMGAALSRHLENELLRREAARRGWMPAGEVVAGPGVARGDRDWGDFDAAGDLESAGGPVGHLRRVAATRWLSPPPNLSEVLAFIDLRREGYADILPQVSLNPGEFPSDFLPDPEDPAWLDDPALGVLQRTVRMEMQAGEHRASVSQFMGEIAAGRRLTLTRRARGFLDLPVGAYGELANQEREGDPAMRGAGNPWDPTADDPWGRTAALVMEELSEGRFDLWILVPPGESLHLIPPPDCTLLASPDEIGVLVSGGAAGSSPTPSEPGWRVVRDRLTCTTPGGDTPSTFELAGTGDIQIDIEFRNEEGLPASILLPPETRVVDISAAFDGRQESGGAILMAAVAETLRSPGLWLLAMAMSLAGGRFLAAFPLALVFAVGHGAGGGLARMAGSVLPPGIAGGVALGSAVIVCIPMAAGLAPRVVHGQIGPPWVAWGLVGLMLGAAGSALVDPGIGSGAGDWSSRSVELTRAGWAAAGALAGVLPILLISGAIGRWSQGRIAGADAADRTAPGASVFTVPTSPSFMAHLVGILAAALLLPILIWSLVAFPFGLPRVVFECAAIAIVCGLILPLRGYRPGMAVLPAFLLLVATGMALPVAEGWGPGLAVVPSAILLLAGAFLLPASGAHEEAGTRTLRRALALAGVGALSVGLVLRGATGPTGSLQSASAYGTAIVALALVWVAARVSEGLPVAARGRVAATVALVALVLGAGVRLVDYMGPGLEGVRTEMALGRISVPLLALTLVALAWMLRPRRSSVAEELGLSGRPGRSHLWVLALAFLLLPFGVIHLPLPGGAGRVPGADDAQRIVAQLLNDTYHAFNLEDEDELYERLAENVTASLLPTLFLDSRRRLSGGVAEGDQVAVLAVRLVSDGTGAPDPRGDGAFAWSGQWTVGALITHMSHTHRRDNLYAGTVTVRPDGGRWKLESIVLASEERTALPMGSP